MTLAASAVIQHSSDEDYPALHHVDFINSFLKNLKRSCRADRVFIPIDACPILTPQKSAAGVAA